MWILRDCSDSVCSIHKNTTLSWHLKAEGILKKWAKFEQQKAFGAITESSFCQYVLNIPSQVSTAQHVHSHRLLCFLFGNLFSFDFSAVRPVNLDTRSRKKWQAAFLQPVAASREVFNLSDAAIAYEEKCSFICKLKLGLPFLPRLNNRLQARSAFVLEWISFHLGAKLMEGFP